MRNANKSPKFSGEGNGKVIQNPYPEPEHHKKYFLIKLNIDFTEGKG